MSTFIANDKYLCNTISRITCAIALFLDEVQVVANLREKIYDKQGLTSLLRCTSIGQNFQWIRNALFLLNVQLHSFELLQRYYYTTAVVASICS